MNEENWTSQNLYTSLKELGLTEQETALYMVSLKLGPSPIIDLARGLGISRPNVYKLIKNLEIAGLAKYSTKEKYTRNFNVESPTIVLERLRQKREELNKLDISLSGEMSDLLAGYFQGENQTKIRVYKGKEQYIKIFDKSIEEEKKEIMFCGSSKDFIDFVSWENELSWIKRRVKRNISIKVLTFGSETASELQKDDKEELRETRIIKNLDFFESSFMLFGNKVVFWQPKAPLAVVIEDQFIFKMMKSIFQALWQISKN